MQTSKFLQLDPKVLMEFIYDDNFLVAENYVITQNSDTNRRSYSAQTSEGSLNRIDKQLVQLDPVVAKYGIMDENQYNFLQNKNYAQTLPIKYDRVKLHFPIDYNFADNIGCFLRVLALDYKNNNLIELSNYFFDKTDQARFNAELQLSSPPKTYNGKIWGKFIEITVPSVNEVSLQREDNQPTSNSLNFNLTGGVDGLSTTAPIMIEFGFLTQKDTINGVITYLQSAPFQTSVPQVPEFQNLGIKIEPSEGGDWFDIFGTYNSTIAEFNNWITTSIQTGKRYFVEYQITLFEENIKGKTTTIVVRENFSEKVEYRPIIKFSTTTAVIEVYMRIIDQVDGSVISRTGAYGMLSDEISKYSRSLVRVEVNGIKTPKIYNIRSGGSIFDAFGGLNRRLLLDGLNGTDRIETIRVPVPLLVSNNNVVAKSESALLDGREWKGLGKLKLVVTPFDNIFQFVIAQNVENKIEYLNLLDVGTVELFFKNHNFEIKSSLFEQSDAIDLSQGTVVFRLNKTQINDVRRIFQSGVNVFYITSTDPATNQTSVLYHGTFIMSDSIEYVNELAKDYQDENDDVEIRRDSGQEFAIVTRRRASSDSSFTTETTNAQRLRDINVAQSTFTLTTSTTTTNNTNVDNAG